MLPTELRNSNILFDICQSGDRNLTAVAVTGVGLALCGIEYDMNELQLKKHQLSGEGEKKKEKKKTKKDINVTQSDDIIIPINLQVHTS